MLWFYLAVVLLGVVARVYVAHRKRGTERPPLDDPRWGAAPRKQIAGHKCTECGVKIVLAHHGDACATCGDVAHVESCLAQHERSAHRVEAQAPYR